MQAVASGWLDGYIQAWRKIASTATKRANIKDEDGGVIEQLTHSKSPLKEFPDTAFRERVQEPEKSQPTGARGKNGGKTEETERHVMMQSIAFLIYEINKCSVTMTQQNAAEFMTQFAQTKAISH